MWSTISALFYASRYRSSDAFWAYSYGVFHFCALAWITPYAIFTVKRTGWLTRDLAIAEPAVAHIQTVVPENNGIFAVMPK
jgi:hyaluronan synthase